MSPRKSICSPTVLVILALVGLAGGCDVNQPGRVQNPPPQPQPPPKQPVPEQNAPGSLNNPIPVKAADLTRACAAADFTRLPKEYDHKYVLVEGVVREVQMLDPKPLAKGVPFGCANIYLEGHEGSWS